MVVMISFGNDQAFARHQADTRTNAEPLLIVKKIYKKVHLKMSKMWLFSLGPNVLYVFHRQSVKTVFRERESTVALGKKKSL